MGVGSSFPSGIEEEIVDIYSVRIHRISFFRALADLALKILCSLLRTTHLFDCSDNFPSPKEGSLMLCSDLNFNFSLGLVVALDNVCATNPWGNAYTPLNLKVASLMLGNACAKATNVTKSFKDVLNGNSSVSSFIKNCVFYYER